MPRTDTPTVLIEPRPLKRFMSEATRLYKMLTPQDPLPCFAVLLGTLSARAVHVHEVEFGTNVRASDAAAVEEFTTKIVPEFGAAYENPVRGYWLDARELLRISRRADARGLEVLGSIHMHPDWHRIGPPQARSMPLSARPTAMDEYVFASTSWPVNMICYLESIGGTIDYALQAWGHAAEPAGRPGCAPLPLRIRTDVSQQVSVL